MPAERGRLISALTPPRHTCYVFRHPDPQNNKGTTPVLRVLSLLASVAALAACVNAPPVQEMSDARQAINAAVEANAPRFAPESLGDARRFLEEAEQQIQQEAYGPARMNAVRAKNRASQALRSSLAASETAPR
jgi:hypothetical protein